MATAQEPKVRLVCPDARRPSTDTRLTTAARDHAEELLGFFRRQTRGCDDAQDLRQELFLRLSRLSRLGEIGDLRAYCFRIARNLLVDFHRRGRTDAHLFECSSAADRALCEKPLPEELLSGGQEIARLRAAVDSLPLQHRQALLWARLDGIRLGEIGRRLGVSESMASRYVAQALAHCRRALQEIQ